MLANVHVGLAGVGLSAGPGVSVMENPDRLVGWMEQSAASFMLDCPEAFRLVREALPGNPLLAKPKAKTLGELSRVRALVNAGPITVAANETFPVLIGGLLAAVFANLGYAWWELGVINAGALVLNPAVAFFAMHTNIGNDTGGVGMKTIVRRIARNAIVGGLVAGTAGALLVGDSGSEFVRLSAIAARTGAVSGVAGSLASLLERPLARYRAQRGKFTQAGQIAAFLRDPFRAEEFFAGNPHDFFAFLLRDFSPMLREERRRASQRQDHRIEQGKGMDAGDLRGRVEEERAFMSKMGSFIREVEEMEIAILEGEYGSFPQWWERLQAILETLSDHINPPGFLRSR